MTYSTLKETLLNNKRQFSVPFTAFVNDNSLYLQSLSYFHGIPIFLIIISESLKYEAFHLGVRCYINSLSKNRITIIDRWSTLEEAVRFLNCKECNNKMSVTKDQVEAMCSAPVGNKVYNPEIIIRAFEYFATSRSLYNRLKLDYQLPSIQTLTRITSKVSKLGELDFLQRIFNSIEENQKECTIIFDEVYVKQMMLYHGGIIFGKACNNPSLLANTVLGIMVDCMYGGQLSYHACFQLLS